MVGNETGRDDKHSDTKKEEGLLQPYSDALQSITQLRRKWLVM